MKKLLQTRILILLTGLLTFFSFEAMPQSSLVLDSVTMGSGYSNDVYYSMANSIVSVTPRDQWDIAFRATIMSSSIITNDGTGVVLYTYPNSDTNGWASVDTSGLSTWVPMYNDPDDWENGAFCRNATDHPDYGWGIYNSTTHNLKGDSIFIIKLRNESFRKIWIEKKYSALNTYVFKYAYLDGSDEHEVTLDCNPYITKEYVGFNLAMNVTVDFQPPKTDWDLVFTKYMSIQPNGTPYPVTGVLSNINTGVGEHAQVGPGFSDWGTDGFEYARSVIGYDWKVFDMGSFTYICRDSLVYFVQDQPLDVYEMIFTKFEGTSTGKVVFGKSKVSLAGIDQPVTADAVLSLYPNPVSGHVNISWNTASANNLKVRISDVLGKVVYENHLNDIQGAVSFSVPVDNWDKGMYIVTMSSDSHLLSQKMIVR